MKISGAAFLLVLALVTAGCSESSSVPTAPSPILPTVPSPAPPPSPIELAVFTDPAPGFSTAAVHEVQDQIVSFNTANELIWTADGTRLPGYRAEGNFIPAEASCKCTFVVHFGTRNGERRWLVLCSAVFAPRTS